MKRILFVGQTGELGGAELVMVDMARHLRHHCGVVLLTDGPLHGRLLKLGVPVKVVIASRGLLGVRRQGGALRSLAAIPSLIPLIWRLAVIGRHYDILYPNSQKAAVVTMLAGMLARRPVVWHLHDILSSDHFASLQRRVVIALSNRLVRRVIANSTSARDAFVACGGDSRRVTVVLNGIDPAVFDAVPETEVQRLRHSFNVGQATLVGLFGRLSSWKGQHVLIEALAQLPDVHALFVGDALFGEDDYKAQLLRRASELGIGDRIHWLGFRDDVPALMRTVDLVLHTSTAPEPFGRVIVEAMLARRPLLAASDGASVELLGDQSPELVQSGDPSALAAAIRRTVATPVALQEARIAENYRRAREHFSTNRMMADLDRELALVAVA